MGYLEALCKIGPRMSGTDGMKKQQELLEKHFTELGGKVTYQRFNTGNQAQNFENLARIDTATTQRLAEMHLDRLRALNEPQAQIPEARPVVARQLHLQRVHGTTQADPAQHSGDRECRDDAGQVQAWSDYNSARNSTQASIKALKDKIDRLKQDIKDKENDARDKDRAAQRAKSDAE